MMSSKKKVLEEEDYVKVCYFVKKLKQFPNFILMSCFCILLLV